jgi:hypothetical protein
MPTHPLDLLLTLLELCLQVCQLLLEGLFCEEHIPLDILYGLVPCLQLLSADLSLVGLGNAVELALEELLVELEDLPGHLKLICPPGVALS